MCTYIHIPFVSGVCPRLLPLHDNDNNNNNNNSNDDTNNDNDIDNSNDDNNKHTNSIIVMNNDSSVLWPSCGALHLKQMLYSTILYYTLLVLYPSQASCLGPSDRESH